LLLLLLFLSNTVGSSLSLLSVYSVAGYPSADAEKAHARPHPRIRRDDGDFWSTHERFLFFISLYYPCDSGNKRTKEAKGNAAAATTNI
jgi:hypothetical protein